MAIQSTYDPTSANPYEAPPPPQQQGNVPGTDPMPAKPSPFGGQPGYQFKPEAISHGGAIAGIADNVLRGIVNGHAQQEQWKALKLKKKSDDLNASWKADAQRLTQVAYNQYQATGKVDTNSPEYQAAKSAKDGSWGALNDFRTQLLEQQTGGAKKKGKPKQGEPPKSPQAVLTDPASTQEEKLQAILGVSQKLGDPTDLQIASLNSPQAAEHWQQQQDAVKFNDLHSRNEYTHEQALETYNKYAGMSEEQLAKLPQAQQDAFRNAKAVITPMPKASSVAKQYSSPDGKEHNYFVPGSEPEGWQAYNRPAASEQAPKVGSFGDFMTAAYGAKPTPKQYVDGRKLWASSGAGTTTGEHVVMVPQPDGSIVPVTIMTSSSKSFGGSPPAPDARQDSATPPTTPPVASGSPSASVAAAPTAPTTPTRRQRVAPPAGATPPVAAPPPRHAGAGVVAVGNPVGGRLTPVQSKANEDVVAATKLDSLATQAIQAREPGQQRQLALGLIKAMAGRVNMQEYSIYTKNYGVANTIDGLIQGIQSGKMPQAVVLQLARDAHANLKAAKEAQRVAYSNPNTPATVKMRAPGKNGVVQDVPADQVDHYKSIGATVEN
jgi:hypothetical protein